MTDDDKALKYNVQDRAGFLQPFPEMSARIKRDVQLSRTWASRVDFKPMKTLYVDGVEVLSYSPEDNDDARALYGTTKEEVFDKLEEQIWEKLAEETDR